MPLAMAAGPALLSLALYVVTLAPTVTFKDSGQLALVVFSHGVDHPPGAPFYLLLAEIPAAVPMGRLIVRLNLFSAVSAAIGVGLVYLGARQVALDDSDSQPAIRRSRGRKGGTRPESRRRSKGETAQPTTGRVSYALAPPAIAIASAAAALFWAVSLSFWSQATVTEVYTLFMATVVGAFLALAGYRRAAMAGNWRRADRCLGLAALLTGLSLSVHYSSGLMAPAVFYLLIRTEGWNVIRRWKRLLGMAGLIMLGLSCYLLLPIRAAYHPLFNWGEVDSWAAFWRQVTARQYQVFLKNPFAQPLSTTLRLWSDSLGFFLPLWWRQGLPVGLPLTALGLVGLWRGRRTWFWFTVLIALAEAAYALNYQINDPTGDYDIYYLLIFWVTALWSGAGIAVILYRLQGWLAGRENALARRGIALALLVLPVLPMALNWSEADHSHYTWAEDYARSVLQPMAPNGVLLSRNWALLAPSIYLHFVEGVRPDITIIDQELLRRTWYFNHLSRAYPWLTTASKASIDALMPDLIRFENDQSYDPQQIQANYIGMINDFLAKSEASGHVLYATDDIEAGIAVGYRRVPETLADRLARNDLPATLPAASFPPPQYAAGRVYDDVVGKVLGDYAAFWEARGQFYQAQQKCGPEAVSAFDHAATLLRALAPGIQDQALGQHPALASANRSLAQCRPAQ